MFVLNIKGEKKIEFHFSIKSQMPPEMTGGNSAKCVHTM